MARRQRHCSEDRLSVDSLTPRQQREINYHRTRAAEMEAKKLEPVNLNVTIQYPRRRWFNAYWETYRLAKNEMLAGKRILVPGCGYGEDACRLSNMGAEVYAFDISSESIGIARARAARHELKITFATMPAEKLEYPDNFFDAVFFLDVLHHVDIPKAIIEFRRVLKPGALMIGDELYTHSIAQRIRNSKLVRHWLYPKMRRFIYGSDEAYITPDEHKIDERELDIVLTGCSVTHWRHFNLFAGRLVPQGIGILDRLDRIALMLIGPLGRYVAGRAVFVARMP